MMEKDGKNQFKILGIQCLFISIIKSSNFKRKPFFVTSFWNWFYIGKSMFFEIYLKLFHWKSINFSIFPIQLSLCWRKVLIDYLPDSSWFWIFVGKDFNFFLDLFKIRKLVLVGDFELLKQNLDKKVYFFQKTSSIFSTLENKF